MTSTSNIVYCLLSEFITAFTPLVGSYSTLKDKVPKAISNQMDVIGEVSNQLAKEVVELREHLDERIDLQSPAKAAEQINKIASDWKRYESTLSAAVTQIQMSDVKMENPRLDAILNKTLPGGLDSLKHMLSLLEAIEPKHLAPYEGLFRMPEI
jgi:hypothetical protein